MSARKIKAASSAAAPSNGKAAGAASVKSNHNPAKGDDPKATGNPDDIEDAIGNALGATAEKFAAGGVKWNRANTGPCKKDFTIKIRLDVADRIKLGMLVAGLGMSPERFLFTLLRGKFDECAARLLKQEGAMDFYCAALCATMGGTRSSDGAARLTFVPAVMA